MTMSNLHPRARGNREDMNDDGEIQRKVRGAIATAVGTAFDKAFDMASGIVGAREGSSLSKATEIQSRKRSASAATESDRIIGDALREIGALQREELDQLQQAFDSIEEQLDGLRKEHAKTAIACNVMRNERDEAVRSNTELRSERIQLYALRDRLVDENAELKSQVTEARTTIESREKEIEAKLEAKLRKDREDATAAAERLREAVKTAVHTFIAEDRAAGFMRIGQGKFDIPPEAQAAHRIAELTMTTLAGRARSIVDGVTANERDAAVLDVVATDGRNTGPDAADLARGRIFEALVWTANEAIAEERNTRVGTDEAPTIAQRVASRAHARLLTAPGLIPKVEAPKPVAPIMRALDYARLELPREKVDVLLKLAGDQFATEIGVAPSDVLGRALRHARIADENLTAVQARCTELINEVRSLRDNAKHPLIAVGEGPEAIMRALEAFSADKAVR